MVLLLDVDFVPFTDGLKALQGPVDRLTREGQRSKRAYVVPAFERTGFFLLSFVLSFLLSLRATLFPHPFPSSPLSLPFLLCISLQQLALNSRACIYVHVCVPVFVDTGP